MMPKKKDLEHELGLDIDWKIPEKDNGEVNDPLDDVKGKPTIKNEVNDPLDDVKTLKDIKKKGESKWVQLELKQGEQKAITI